VVASGALHRENLVRSMVSGWKRGHPDDGIPGMRTVAGVLLLAAVAWFWWAW
jgi:hypothetical protein